MKIESELLASELERLLALPLRPNTALTHWYDEARKVEHVFRTNHPGFEIPDEIWHFFADADIRSKESETKYREIQEGLVRQYILSIRQGLSASCPSAPANVSAASGRS